MDNILQEIIRRRLAQQEIDRRHNELPKEDDKSEINPLPLYNANIDPIVLEKLREKLNGR
jgi:hypothetical protein